MNSEKKAFPVRLVSTVAPLAIAAWLLPEAGGLISAGLRAFGEAARPWLLLGISVAGCMAWGSGGE